MSDKPAIEHMMSAVNAKNIWYKLNNIWVIYFIVLGAINLAVAYSRGILAPVQGLWQSNHYVPLHYWPMPLLAKYIEEPETNKDIEKNR